MICINLPSTDPAYNLAVDEYLLRNSREDFMIAGVNSRSVIIGKHQVAHRESETKFLFNNKIPLFRRITGGGTVYHDEGNINFSFILNSKSGSQVNFDLYTAPVREFFRKMGIEVILGPKNELLLNNFKISGNAEHVFRERVLHHGTLLYDASLSDVRASIRKDISKYSTRGVNSNPAHVANIKSLTGSFMTVDEFRNEFFGFFAGLAGNSIADISSFDPAEIERIASARYNSWEWNYAYGPDYEFRNTIVASGGKYDINLGVSNGIIKRCTINGPQSFIKLQAAFEGQRHMPEDLLQAARNEGSEITEQDVLNFF